MPSCSIYTILYTVYHSKEKTIAVKHKERNSLSTKDPKAPNSTRSLQGMSHMAGFMIHLMHVINEEIILDGKKLQHCCYWFKTCCQIFS